MHGAMSETYTTYTGARDHTGDTAGILGTIVTWRVPRQVDLHTLRQSVSDAGIDGELVADMAPRNAVRRALRELRQGRVIRALRQDEDRIYFQLTAEIQGEYEIEYHRECEVACDLETGCLTGDSPEIVAKAQEYLDEHREKRLTGDLTRLVQKVFDARKADLVPIREQGGAYFVPHTHTDLVDSVRKLLKGIGGRLRSFDVRLGSADTSESVAESLGEYLIDMVAEFRESCSDVTGDSRKDVVSRRQDRVAELRSRLDCYRGILAGWADHIGEQIDKADLSLMEQLTKSLEGDGGSASAEAQATQNEMDF